MTENKLVSKTLWISEITWNILKDYCGRENMRISHFIRESVKDTIKRRGLNEGETNRHSSNKEYKVRGKIY